ncbi:hypothetical protein HPB52_015790 [Rhipicephalus sanguineus]|uniref:Uncharacterized protein n=1 Tax=Rhipicephalus sanguineus TaxID=34632 RepID=A0A9D4Q746_RHISA|nr:hypothetical protein HPB52_015790 [Rhipicephalus sanguineus]
MASPIPPPLFLSTPGDPPIPWADWKLIFEAYVDAIGKDAAKPERRKALLINALGYAGLKLYQTLSSANASETPASADVFQAALALFDDHFKDANFLLRGARAPVLCFTGRANMAALLLRLGAAVNMAARLHSPFVAVNMAAPQLCFVDCVDRSCIADLSHGFCVVHCVTAYGFGDIFFVDAGSTCECVCFASCGVPCACACASVYFRCASAGRACRCAGALASVHFADASASQGCPTGTSTFSLWNASFARWGGLAKRV